jgi:hypothetical protein
MDVTPAYVNCPCDTIMRQQSLATANDVLPNAGKEDREAFDKLNAFASYVSVKLPVSIGRMLRTAEL